MATNLLLREEHRGNRTHQSASVQPGAPTEQHNWDFNPKELNLDVNSAHDVLVQYMVEKKLTPDDLLRTFVSRRVCLLQTRVHKICHMSGPLDPTRVSTRTLTKAQVKQRVKAIARSNMEDDWVWGVEPYERDRPAPNVSFCFLVLPKFLDPRYFHSGC